MFQSTQLIKTSATDIGLVTGAFRDCLTFAMLELMNSNLESMSN